MKRIVPILMCLLVSCIIWTAEPIDSYAATSGDFEYKILDDGTAEITRYVGTATELEIPTDIDGYTVTRLGFEAITYNDKLEKIILNEGLTSIGIHAMSSCTSLKEVILPSTVKQIEKYAFNNCFKLEEIALNEGLETIGECAFEGCTNLTMIVMPSTLEKIEFCAFADCSALNYIVLNEGLQQIGGNIVANTSIKEVMIPSTVSPIDAGAFGNSEIENIYVNKNNPKYESISGVLFEKNEKALVCYPPGRTAASYVLPEGITKIERYAIFNNNLKSITLPKAFNYIDTGDSGSYVFGNCENIYVNSNNPKYASVNGVLLNKAKTKIIVYPKNNKRTSYTIPTSVTTIGDYAFYNADKLKTITFYGGIRSIGNYSFSECDSIKNISLKGKITKMGKQAFSYCDILNTLNIGNQVTVIGEESFQYCPELSNVTMGKRVEKIEAGAFAYCLSMESVKIPSSVTHIGPHAFLRTVDSVRVGDDEYEYTYHPLKNIYYAGNEEKWDKIDGEHQYTPNKYNYCTKAGVTHSYKKMLTKATRYHDGSYDTRCSKCGNIKAKISTIYKIDSIKLSYAKAKYNGKTKTPAVTVKNSNGKKLVKGTDYTVKYESGRQKVGTYTVTVTFKGKYYGTVKRYFDIVPKATAIKSLTKGASQITVKWQKVTKQISGYQIRYGTVQNMADAKQISVKNYKTTSKTIKNLKEKQKYYVQVRVYKNVDGKTYYGKWSPKKNITTQ